MLNTLRKLPFAVRMMIGLMFGQIPMLLWLLLLGVGFKFLLGVGAVCTVAGTVTGVRMHRRERNRGHVRTDPRPVAPLSMDDFGVHRGREAAARRSDASFPAVPPLARPAFTASYRECGHESGDRTIAWARAHPRIASLIPWFFVACVLCETSFAILGVVEGRWRAVAYYGPGIVLGGWAARSWRRINRGLTD